MKKNLTLFLLMLLGTIGATNHAKAQDLPQAISVCLHDGFGYVWSLTLTSTTGGMYTGEGTVNIGSGQIYDATVTYNSTTHATTFRADNPNADGCASGFTDSFTYSGTATASYSHHVVTYNGSGTWKSYCSGVVVGLGTWSATDCAHKGGVIDPDGPANHAAASLIKVSPNPINGQGTISYSVAKSGTVNITVYNSMQQVIKVLVNDFKTAGNYSTVWDSRAGNAKAGIYRVVAVVNGKTYSTTVQVIR